MNKIIVGPGGVKFLTICNQTIKDDLTIHRVPGSLPRILIQDVDFEGGLRLEHGGAMTVLERVRFLGRKGLYIHDADGGVIRDCLFMQNGLVTDRWHDGYLSAYARECYNGFFFHKVNGMNMDIRAESNSSFGVHMTDSGIGRYVDRQWISEDGGPNYIKIWLEANNGRGDTGGHGYRYPQMYLRNTARNTFFGHIGPIDADEISKVGNTFIEHSYIPGTEMRTLQDVAWDFPHFPVNWRKPHIANWDAQWLDADKMPKVYRSPPSGPVIVTWPPGSFDATNKNGVAYWNLFHHKPLKGPGAFQFIATVSDATGTIAEYCKKRLDYRPRRRPLIGTFVISPVGGAITSINIYDRYAVQLIGQCVVDTARDVGLHFNPYVKGMEGGDQTRELQLIIHELTLKKIN